MTVRDALVSACYNHDMAKRRTNRRQFLTGRSAVHALDEMVDSQMPAPSGAGQTDAPSRSYLLQITRRAMACDFAVLLNAGQFAAASELAVEALDLVEALEDQLTVYRDHSEVSRINRSAADEAMPVDPRLFELFQHAVELHRETNGAFDITAGPLSKVWGFYRRQGRVPDKKELRHTLDQVGSNWLELDADARTIRFNKPGVEINLGGIGKGYALDRCVEFLLESDVEHFLIHGGQSSVCARGSRMNAGGAKGGWVVGLKHPLRPNLRLAEIRLRDRALGTSGSGTQSFHHQGRRYGHILDPRTGWPSEGVLSATAIAPSAATADALATGFYVMGVDQTMNFCERHPDVGAILVTASTRRGSVDVHSRGLTEDDWTPLIDV